MDRYFNDMEIGIIFWDDKIKASDLDTLDYKCEKIFTFFESVGIKRIEIKKMIIDFPRMLTYSVESVINNYNSLYSVLGKKINNSLVYCPRIISRNSRMDAVISHFVGYGFTKEDVIKMIIRFPILLTMGIDKIDVCIGFLDDLIKDRNKVIKLIKRNPNILSFSINKLVSKVKWFYDKGYTKEQVGNIICKANSLLTMDFENNEGNINSKYNYLKNTFGFNIEEIIDITNRCPVLYSLSIENISNKINVLLELGFSIDMVKIIFFKFPQIVSCREETILEKYNYYNELGLLRVFVECPKYLMQGLELTNARYTYLLGKGIEVSERSYKKLFLSNKSFKKSYGITNEELLERYRSLIESNEEIYGRDVKVLQRKL